ncbi:MAG: phospho-N-acetylmuramoyl-pentapeptide-transferase [Armatimonadota bacterium]|nr:phospho-N-acetylmuramoyl-pentapeptide-transferase [Armatimonadota bacterium]
MNNAAIAFLIATVVSLLIGHKTIALLTSLKVRQTISEDVPERHREKQGTPTMGGLIILVGAAAGAAAVWVSHAKIAAVALLTLAFAVLGFIDDYLIASRGKSLGLKARHKLLGQFLIAIAFVWWLHVNRTPATTVVHLWGNTDVHLGWAYYPLAVLLIVWISNAFNLADGLDGLVAGLTTIIALTLGALVVLSAESGLTVLAWALAGGCVGFLWYNANPARIFMGDTGSLALGAATAGIAIAGKRELLYILIALVIVIEGLSVMIQVASFKLTGKRVFKMTPIHHHFELMGWPEQKIVVRFWLVSGLIAFAILAGMGMFRIWH